MEPCDIFQFTYHAFPIGRRSFRSTSAFCSSLSFSHAHGLGNRTPYSGPCASSIIITIPITNDRSLFCQRKLSVVNDSPQPELASSDEPGSIHHFQVIRRSGSRRQAHKKHV